MHRAVAESRDAPVRLAFTPRLLHPYVSGKYTSDNALALDALGAMFDGRADTICLVTSDSDGAYLCRKLRERGATVHIVGETKSPEGRVGLGALGQYLKRTDPAFSPKAFGHSGLLDMVQTYTDLVAVKDGGGYWVSPKPRTETGTNGA